MGTWGVKTFDNDANSDWLYDLEDIDDLSMLEEALNPEDTSYLEAEQGEMILAAAEIINGILSEPRDEIPEEAQDWIKNHKQLKAGKLIDRAIAMIDLVLSENSELRELWEENTEEYPRWRENVFELRDRLTQ